MGENLNKLLLRQIKRHYGSVDNLPVELKGIIQDISNTYYNYEDDTLLLQNSIEISSQELRDGFLKQKKDAESQKETINKIKEAIFALNPSDQLKYTESEPSPSNSMYLFDSLIKLIEERKEAEEALRESEFRMKSLTSTAQDAILMMEPEGRVSYWNAAAERIFGYTYDEAIGHSLHDLIVPSHFQELHQIAFPGFQVTGEGAAIGKTLDLIAIRKDGKEISVQLSLSSFKLKDGWHAMGILRDITERRLMENQLKESENLQRSLLENVAVGIVIIDPETSVIESVNTFASLLIKESKENIIGRKCHMFICPVQDQCCPVCDQGQESDNSESTLLRADKTSITVLKTVKRIKIGGKEKLLESFVDISVQKEAEEALLQSSKKWEAIISASPDGIGMASLDGNLQLMSDKLALMYGYTVEQKNEFIGTPFIDFIDPSNHALLLDNIRKLFAGENDQKITEYLAIKKDNSRFCVDVNSTVLFDSKGNPESILFVERDITDRKQAEEALHNERTLFRTIIDLIPDAVYVKDVSGRKIIANPKEVQFAGKNSEEEIVGKTDFELYPDKDAKRALAEDQFVLDSGNPIFDIDGSLIDKKGKVHWLLCSKVPLRDVHGKITGIVGVTHDITERKRAEEALAQAADRLAIATKAGGVGIWDLDIASNKLFWDNQMYRLYGIKPDQYTSVYENWQAGMHPDDRARSLAEIQMAIKGEKEFDTEFRIVWSDGSIHNVRALAFVMRDNKGIPLRMIGTNWDITEQKKTEAILLKAKQEADLANKAKSEFLANMSHEIRTPLNGVIGFTDLLQKTPLNKIQRQYADNVNASGHTLLGIINDILDFSKIEAGKMELDLIKTDIFELAEQTSDIIKYHASQKGIEFLLNIQPDIPRFVNVDPIRLKQILVNLLGNAVKFTDSGEIELKVTFVKKDECLGEFIFSVRDTGIGINEEQQNTLFKAFTQADSSTTRKFGGTGLGLAISNMLAEKMGSKIEIISEPGRGSTFFFSIETEYEVGEKLHSGSITDIHRVLVIDDNDNNRLILEHTFKNWGIEFVGIDNGLSALKLIQKSPLFDVIIVDYHMPYLNGLETIRMVREQLNLSPEKQPVILLHSSADDIQIYEECKKLGVRFNLTKPVKSQELLHYLRSIHNQPATWPKESKNEPMDTSFGLANDSAPVILVAEDVALNMLLVTTIIKQMIPNVFVLEVKNGIDAFNTTISKNPDLILMDVQMPEMSGIEATVKLRNYEKGKGTRIPVVALTAGAIKGEREKCLEAGMDDFLTKPIDQNALNKILKKHLIAFYKQSGDSIEKINKKRNDLHFDEIMLMENIGNSQIIFEELFEVVPLQFSHDIESLDKAISEKHLEGIKRAAHSIKGAALNMCFNILAELASEIEMSIEDDNVEKLDAIYKDLILEWEQIQVLLKNKKL